MKTLITLLFLSTNTAFAADDECAYFKFCGSAAPTKSTSSSSSRSASLNPSNIARVKGLGVETLLQDNNDPAFTFVTGTGNVGGALISSSGENSFFGNRSLELDDEYYVRYTEKKRYTNNKLSAALGAKLYDKRKMTFDLGISLKRNKFIKKINPGVGFTAGYKNFTFGAHIYKDDVRLNLSNTFDYYSGQSNVLKYNSFTYDEYYTVKTATIGLKIENLTFDIGYLSTRYKFYNIDTNILIYTLGYNFKKLYLTAAYRSESSANRYFENDTLIEKNNKTFYHYGAQLIVFKHLMLGVGYNTFMMNEVSATVTVFIN